ncbi:hypothetical protein [Streptomyces sp. NRRL S-350]|uniref:hypothetical protein n=1 Tax=Streptomyces sp. NRRL S-350 TaxID=1463902 RepID=UPI0004C13C73|nr:hypothetical protein [Streptomyces sp. NRRL S-350]
MAKHRVETKVKAGAAFAYLGTTGLLAVLAEAQDNARLLDWMPDSISPFILSIIPGTAAFVAGWKARHSPRQEE